MRADHRYVPPSWFVYHEKRLRQAIRIRTRYHRTVGGRTRGFLTIGLTAANVTRSDGVSRALGLENEYKNR